MTSPAPMRVIERAAPHPKQTKIWEIVKNTPPGGMSLIGFGGAAGGGKTRAIVELAIDLAQDFPGNKILIGRKDYADLRTTTMEQFDLHCPSPLIVARNDTEHWRDIRLKDWPPGVKSRVVFRETKDYLGLGSEEYGAILLDEAGEIPKNSALMLLSRLRWKLPDIVMKTPRRPETPWGRITEEYPDGRPIKYIFFAASNPWPGWFEDWFIKRNLDEERLRVYSGKLHFIPSLVTDNPSLAENYAERLRGLYPEHWVKRMLEGRWDAFEGQVYPQFNEDLHCWRYPLPPPETWKQIVGGLDFGGNNPHDHMSAGIVSVVLRSNRIIRVDEFEERGKHVYDRQLAWMLAMESKWCNRHTGAKIHWIADRSQMVAIEQWKRLGFRVKASKGGPRSVDFGISMVGRRLDVDPTGLPGSFYLPTLECFPERMRTYRYADPSGSDDQAVRVQPIKRNDDLVDADRYMHEALEATLGDPELLLKNILPVVRSGYKAPLVRRSV